MSAVETSAFNSENGMHARMRWGGSFAAVLTLHVGVAVAAATWVVPVLVPQAPPPAVMIDMMPTPPAPPQVVEAKPDIKPDEMPVVEKAEVVLHKPKHKPKPKVEQKKEPDAPKSSQAPAAPAAPMLAKSPVEAQPAVSPNYLSLLYAHLERHKRYPAAAQRRRQTGTVYLRFTIDKSGHVLSSRIDRSSGVISLDMEATTMLRRADPLPPLPQDMHQDTFSVIVPVRFNLKN